MYIQNLIEQTRKNADTLARKANAAQQLREDQGLYDIVYRMGQLTDRISYLNGNSLTIASAIMFLSALGMLLEARYAPGFPTHWSLFLFFLLLSLLPAIGISSFLYVRFVIYRKDRKTMIRELSTLCDAHPEAVEILDHIEPHIVRYINKILMRTRKSVPSTETLAES